MEAALKKARIAWAIIFALVCLWRTSEAGGDKGTLGIGFRAGITQFESDIQNPALGPLAYGHVKFNPNAFLSIGTEFGWGELKDKADKSFKTSIMPFELDLTFNFLPLGKVNPYVLIGGGGVYWNSTRDGLRIIDKTTSKTQEGIDSFAKTGGGLEFILNQKRNLTLSIGLTYRYSFSDMLDQDYSGDETDQVIDIYGGLTYYFKTSTKGDRDSDGISDILDLDPRVPEDADGYLDHDGKPEEQEGDRLARMIEMKADSTDQGEDKDPPYVVHHPVRIAEQGRDINLTVNVIENKGVRVVAALYRTLGEKSWQVRTMNSFGSTIYQGKIPGIYVKPPGVEYAVVAVDEAVSGIGYSGLPKRPNVIEVIAKPKQWRILSATTAILSWGAAGYLIYRKQK
jgi:hypothetical protein